MRHLIFISTLLWHASIWAQVDPDIDFDDLVKTYGDSDFSLMASSPSDGTINYSIDGVNDGTISLSGSNMEIVTINKSGSVVIRANQDAGTGYNAGSETMTLTISAALLTVTGLTGDNKEYDGDTDATAIGTAELDGEIIGDVVSLDGTPTYTFASSDVAVGITISTTGYTLTGADAVNYTLTQPTLSADITAKDLTVTGLTGDNKEYDGDTDATASGTAELDGEISGDVVSLDGTPTYTFASSDVAVGITISTTGYTLTGADAVNYILTQPTLSADITAKDLTVTGLTGDNKEYDGDTDATASGTAELDGEISGDMVSLDGTPTYTFASSDVGVGITISTTGYTLTGADAINYTLTQPTLSADITAKDLTVTGLTGDNKEYDGDTDATASGTAELDGEISGDVVSLDGTPTYTFASSDVAVGITISTTGYTLTGADAINYTLTQPTLSADITAKDLTVTGLTGDNKEYDGDTDATASGTAELDGEIIGDVVSLDGTPTYTFASSDVGVGITISTTGYTLTGADAVNYTLTQPTLSADITAKDLTVTGLTGDNKEYDGDTNATASGTAELDGEISGDVVSLDGTPTYTFASSDVAVGITISTTGYTLTGADAVNYTLTQPTLSADITAKDLTVTGLTGDNKEYDGDTDATAIGTAELDGEIIGDVVSLDGTPTYTFASSDVAVGITISTTGYTLTGADAVNYTLTQPTLSADITAKDLTVTGLTGDNKEYDGDTDATASGTAELDGEISGDVVSLDGTPTYTFASSDVAVGITISTTGYTLTGADAVNYILTQPTLSADITAKDLTVTGLTGDNKEYDGDTDATASGTAELDGEISGDMVSLDGTPTYTFASSDVGVGITISTTGYTLTGADAINYTLTQPTLSADITAKDLTVTGLTGDNKEYDGDTDATASGTAELDGEISGDVVSLDGTPTYTFASSDVAVGITISTTGYTLTGADAGNYTLIQPTLSADITAKDLMVSLTVNEKEYDGETTATITMGTPELDGVVDGDDVVLDDIPDAFDFDDENVGDDKPISITGSYTISGTDANNYIIIQPSGLMANINPRTLTVNVEADSKVYDGNKVATVTLGTPELERVVDGDDVVIDESPSAFNFSNRNVGTNRRVSATGDYTITGTQSNNYLVSQPSLSAAITAKDLSVNVTADNKTYDGETTATVTLQDGALAGIVDGDEVEIDEEPERFDFDTRDVGDSKSVTASGSYTITGAQSANYSVLQPLGLLANISAKELIVNVTVDDKEYDSETTATVTLGTPELEGIVDGDDVNIDDTPSVFNFDSEEIGDGKSVSFTGSYTIAGSESGNYDITQPSGLTARIFAKRLTVNVTADDKVYDGGKAANVTLGNPELIGVVDGDDVVIDETPESFNFRNRNVGDGRTVLATGDFTIAGVQSNNYDLIQPTLNADITAKELMVNVTADDKVYDGVRTASVTLGDPELEGVVDGDEVTLDGEPTRFDFDTKDVGETKTVTATGNYTIAGAQSGNYFVTQPVGLTADVTKKELQVFALIDTIIYGDNPNLGPFYQGFVPGEDDEELDIQPVITGYEVCNAVGIYDLTFATRGRDNNYSLLRTDGELTVVSDGLSVEGFFEACDDSLMTLTAINAFLPDYYFWYDASGERLDSTEVNIFDYVAQIEQPAAQMSYRNSNGCFSDTVSFSLEIVPNPPLPNFVDPVDSVCVGQFRQRYLTDTPADSLHWSVAHDGSILGKTDRNPVRVLWDSAGASPTYLRLELFNISESGSTVCNRLDSLEVYIRNDVRNIIASEVVDSFACYLNQGMLTLDSGQLGFDYILEVDGVVSEDPSRVVSGKGAGERLYWDFLPVGSDYTVVQRVLECGDYKMPGQFRMRSLYEGIGRRPTRNQPWVEFEPDSNWVASGDIIGMRATGYLGNVRHFLWEFPEADLTSELEQPFMVFNVPDDTIYADLRLFYQSENLDLACRESYFFPEEIRVEDVNGLFDFIAVDTVFEIVVDRDDWTVKLFPNPTPNGEITLTFDGLDSRLVHIQAYLISSTQSPISEQIVEIGPTIYGFDGAELNLISDFGLVAGSGVYILSVWPENKPRPTFITGIQL